MREGPIGLKRPKIYAHCQAAYSAGQNQELRPPSHMLTNRAAVPPSPPPLPQSPSTLQRGMHSLICLVSLMVLPGLAGSGFSVVIVLTVHRSPASQLAKPEKAGSQIPRAPTVGPPGKYLSCPQAEQTCPATFCGSNKATARSQPSPKERKLLRRILLIVNPPFPPRPGAGFGVAGMKAFFACQATLRPSPRCLYPKLGLTRKGPATFVHETTQKKRAFVADAATTHLPVLLLGETGTG